MAIDGVKENNEKTTNESVGVRSEGDMKLAAGIKRGRFALEDGEWEKAKQYFDQVLTLDAECAEAYFGTALADLQAKDPESYISAVTSQSPRIEKLSIPENSAHIQKAVAENAVDGFLKESEITALYQYDLSYDSTLKSQQEIQNQVHQQIENNRNLIRAFHFATAEEKNRMEEIKNSLYDKLQSNVDQAQKQEDENRDQAKRNYETFLKNTDGKAQEMNRQARMEQIKVYQNAVELQGNAKSVSELQAALAELKKTPEFQDASGRIQSCEKAIAEIHEQERLKKEEQARKTAAKRKRKTALLTLLAVLAVAAFFVVIKIVIPEIHKYKAYQEAMRLYSNGDYRAAYSAYYQLRGYKNVDELLKTDSKLVAVYEAKIAPYKKIGNVVKFGAYEQDNNFANGKEAIEWIILDNQDSHSLLISRHALDTLPYNKEIGSITWEKCSLRSWMNGTFFLTAFSQEEQAAVMLTTVDNGKAQGNSEWNRGGGNNTQDKVFLLSYSEADHYFSKNEDRICKATAYAKEHGADNGVNGNCYWWLRSPGKESSFAAHVTGGGGLSSYHASDDGETVRPVLWLDLESEYFMK